MKRLTLLLLGLALGVSATANAQGLTMQMSNGWTFTFAGNVNVFWVFSKANVNAGDASNSNIRTGLLPTFATFEAKGKEGGLTLGVHFGFAPQIQNPDQCHDNFILTCTNGGAPNLGTQAGAQIDMRQVYLTIGLKDGSDSRRPRAGSVRPPEHPPGHDAVRGRGGWWCASRWDD